MKITEVLRKPEDVIDTLERNNVLVIKLNHNWYTLKHNLSDDEFNHLISAIMVHHNLQPQDNEWCPGTPSGLDEDYGYYLWPSEITEYEDGQFDMLITKTELTWC